MKELLHTRKPCFNLSILECKSGPQHDRNAPSPRFNLSILECKCCTAGRSSMTGTVLIYPYWNVNNVGLQWDAGRQAVLIYPYWNVNRQFVAIIHAKTDGFNLSILECKSDFEKENREHWPGFNLSILECKSLSAAPQMLSASCFNLSILECK